MCMLLYSRSIEEGNGGMLLEVLSPKVVCALLTSPHLLHKRSLISAVCNLMTSCNFYIQNAEECTRSSCIGSGTSRFIL